MTVGGLRPGPNFNIMMLSMSARSSLPAPVQRQELPLSTDLHIPICKPGQPKMAQWPKKTSDYSRIAAAYLLAETGWAYLRRDPYRWLSRHRTTKIVLRSAAKLRSPVTGPSQQVSGY